MFWGSAHRKITGLVFENGGYMIIANTADKHEEQARLENSDA